MFEEPVIEIATREVKTITPDTSIGKAVGIMEQNGIHNLIVRAQEDRSGSDGNGASTSTTASTIYMVNVQDLLLASNPDSPVDEFMFKPHCIRGDTPTIEALCELLDSGQRAAPIVDSDEKLIGIVTEYDIMRRGARSFILRDTRADEVMTRDVVCVDETASIGRVRGIMRRNSMGYLLIVDDARRLTGIVTEGDILRRVYKPKQRMTAGEYKGEKVPRMGQPVSSIMSAPVITASPDANLAEVAGLMCEHAIRTVPVVGKDMSPRGIVSTHAIMQFLSESRKEPGVNMEILGELEEKYRDLAIRIINTEVRKITRLARQGRIHWIKIVIKKERDRGGVSYYKIGAHVKTPERLYVGYGEPGGTKLMVAARGAGEIEKKADKRRWDFIAALKDALLSVRSQMERERESR